MKHYFLKIIGDAAIERELMEQIDLVVRLYHQFTHQLLDVIDLSH